MYKYRASLCDARPKLMNAIKVIVRRYGAKLPKPQKQFAPKKYIGPTYEKTKSLKAKHFPLALQNLYKRPLLLHQGYMQFLYDHENKKYLDLFAGIVTTSVGHCHPQLVRAIEAQMKKLWNVTTIYRQPRMYEFIEKLASKFPKHLRIVFLVNSGTEANSLAKALAKAYTGNESVIGIQDSFHGEIPGLKGKPDKSGSYYTPLPDPLRAVWGGCRDSISQVSGNCCCPEDCISGDKYINDLKKVINAIPSKTVGAMFVEPIQGFNGIVQYPKGYLRKARSLIKEHGGLFVCDEMQTGIGRTGDTFWEFQSQGIVPDIVTLGKGIANGFPLAAVVTTEDIANSHTDYFNTFGGNSMASAAGKAVLEIIEREGLQENSKNVGTYFLISLMQLQRLYPIIGDVRGKGLMIGMEFVKPGTTEPMKADDVDDILEKVKDRCVLMGKAGKYRNVIRIEPPMCISRQDVEFAIDALDGAIKEHLNEKKCV